MYLIVGLGNPGRRYEFTYHNLGFIIVDAICKHWSFQNFSKKDNYFISSGMIDNNRVLLLKPQSFMNNSGVCLIKVLSFYKIALDGVLVIHDDADLKLGKIKIKKGGSSAGHNGLKSIDNSIGNNYWRLRIGIGRPETNTNLADYVLSKFENLDNITQLAEKIAQNIHFLLCQNNLAFINQIM
ncbi:aminoacyl-tRNA hydrolase [Wolbachia endosymbiont of Chironomus riparius]|uniref:aminoacyl-tRNA hydrolase n=1 Tax=Wolbachia endosymbiont of Chironomus riparius TaxID=2883238 RepID=UPI00209EC818|nr:aminoacyl-tRNA hydrolase [Wolbachia endosymbiont of Chironomus riparius]